MADGLDAAAQREVIARIAGQKFRVADLMRKSPVAPFVLKLDTIGTCQGGASLRSVDLWVIAYGRIEQLTSQAFLEDVVKTSAGGNSGGLPSKVEVLDKGALARYGLRGEESPDRAERYFYTTFPMLDRVQISVTRRAVLTQGDASGIAAAIVDRRFDADAAYGNQWQPIDRGPNGQLALGGPQPYHTGGFYAKVTRLAEPRGRPVSRIPPGVLRAGRVVRRRESAGIEDSADGARHGAAPSAANWPSRRSATTPMPRGSIATKRTSRFRDFSTFRRERSKMRKIERPRRVPIITTNPPLKTFLDPPFYRVHFRVPVSRE